MDLKERVADTAASEGLSVNAWAVRCFDANVDTEKAHSVQHAEARRLLPIIFAAARENRIITYADAARALGRDPATNSRMIGGVCDLLDAAAALAGVPLIAFYTVRKSGTREINPSPFAHVPELRTAILDRARKHDFTQGDFDAMSVALENEEREGRGNKLAWRRVREITPAFGPQPSR